MTNIGSMDTISRIIKFPFQDPEWGKKVGIGALVGLFVFIIPFVPAFILLGYAAQIMKRIFQEQGRLALPEWDDWGLLLSDGARLWAVNFIYSLPVLIVFAAAVLGISLVPIPGIIMMEHGEQGAIGMLLLLIGYGGGSLFFVLGMLLAIAVPFITAAASAHMVAKDDFSAAFDYKAWWPILKSGFMSFLIAFIVIYALAMVVSLITQLLVFTLVLCIVLPFIFIVYSYFSYLYTYSFYALAYLDGKNRLNT
ncbi:MAG: DUF4013 domain-containing protein [Anaerolineales bacterium]|nr:DUF4013 domain-containing protein [Anaerolineales bacterium]